MRRVQNTLFSLLIALVIWLVAIGAIIWNYGDKDYAKKSDCAIVLGAAAHGKNPSPVFEERIRHALTLYQRGVVSKIVFTGGYGDGALHAEADVAARYAIHHGVNKADILTETRSRTTRENLVEAKAVMTANNLSSAVVVSDPLHLKRAAMMATDLTISAVTSPTPTSRYRSLKTKFGFLMRELYFFHHYILMGS